VTTPILSTVYQRMTAHFMRFDSSRRFGVPRKTYAQKSHGSTRYLWILPYHSQGLSRQSKMSHLFDCPQAMAARIVALC
jgi:hypothetical protein